MQRLGLGISGLLFLAIYLFMLATRMTAEDRFTLLANVLLKTGLVLCMSWLAFPQLEVLWTRLPKWAWGCILLGVGLLIISPRMAPVAIVVAVAVGFMSFVTWLFKPPASREKEKAD